MPGKCIHIHHPLSPRRTQAFSPWTTFAWPKIHLTHKSRYTNQKHGLLIKFAYLTLAIRMCVCVFIITGSQLHVGIRIGHRLGAGHRHASVSEHGHRWQVHCAIERRIVHK